MAAVSLSASVISGNRAVTACAAHTLSASIGIPSVNNATASIIRRERGIRPRTVKERQKKAVIVRETYATVAAADDATRSFACNRRQIDSRRQENKIMALFQYDKKKKKETPRM